MRHAKRRKRRILNGVFVRKRVFFLVCFVYSRSGSLYFVFLPDVISFFCYFAWLFSSSSFFVFLRDVFFRLFAWRYTCIGPKRRKIKMKWHKPAKVQKRTANFVAEQTGCWVGKYIVTVKLPYTYKLALSPCGYIDRLESLTPIR